MEVTYRRNLYKSYMCIKAQEDVQEEYEVHMLEKQKIPGLLPIQTTMAEGLQTYLYEISGKQQIEDYLSGRKIDYNILQRLLFSIQELCKALQDYLLREDGLCLEFPFIYVNLEDGSMYFTYLPFGEKSLPKAFEELMEQVLRKIDHQDQAATDLAYQIYQMCTKENANIGKMLASALGKQNIGEGFSERLGQDNRSHPALGHEMYEGLFSRGTGNASEKAEKKEREKSKREQAGREETGKGKWHKLTEYVRKREHKEGREAEQGAHAAGLINKMGFLPLFVKESIFFSYITRREKEKPEIVPKEEQQNKGKKNGGYPEQHLRKQIFQKKILEESEREQVREISRKYFQKEESHAESERIKARGILKDHFPKADLEKRFIRESSKACFQEVDLEQVPERRPTRRISQESYECKEPMPRISEDCFQEPRNSQKAEEKRNQEIPKDPFQNLGVGWEGEEALLRGNPKDPFQNSEAGQKAEEKSPRGIPRDCCQESETSQKADQKPLRGIPRDCYQESETSQKADQKPLRGIPRDCCQESETSQKADKRLLRGIPQDCSQESKIGQKAESNPPRGVPRDCCQESKIGQMTEENLPQKIPRSCFRKIDCGQSSEANHVRGFLDTDIPEGKKFDEKKFDKKKFGLEPKKIQTEEITQGLAQSMLLEKAGQGIDARKGKKGKGWLWKRKKGEGCAPSLPPANIGKDGFAQEDFPKETARYATEILTDFGEQPEGILVYQGVHGCGDLFIEGKEFLVGKNKGQVNGFIDARGISRLHARIVQEGGSYYLEDLNSTNGTYLNGVPLEYHQKMELCKDDHIRFGGEEYVFC